MNRHLSRALALAVLILASLIGVAPQGVAAPAQAGPVTVAIHEVDLDGPRISTVDVKVTNSSDQRLSRLAVSFSGPKAWAVEPETVRVKSALRPGQSTFVEFSVQVPAAPAGFRVRTFTATASYAGGDGAGSATGTRVQTTGAAYADLAAAFNNVGVTDETDTAPGNLDGEGNSFSAQKLADVGIAAGQPVEALGATLTWPSAAAGTNDNVATSGQAISLTGSGSKLVFLGTGSDFGATGAATVHYTDGTSSTGTLGFPNWSFQDAGAHGATLVASSVGRNRPSGYGDAAYAYRVFANSIALDPAKQVKLVVLPGNAAVHVFDLAVTG